MLQLSEEEAKAYRDCPTILDINSSFYIFPVSGLNFLVVDIAPQQVPKLA